MCSGRVDLEFIFRAFGNGHDGVFIGGCRLNECNYATHGNYDALGNWYIARHILGRVGVNPERLGLALMSGGDGNLFASTIDAFTDTIRELGPLGETEGVEKRRLMEGIDAVRTLVPYLRLVEREKLRVPERSEEGYRRFYTSDEVKRFFDDLVGDKLALSRIVSLLRENPRSTSEISETVGLSPSQTSRHMASSSRQGIVTYDTASGRYALASDAGRRHGQ
jgi:coenzyme F420-reducing hydrogenase delta subunit